MFKILKKQKHEGFLIVEIILAASVLVLVTTALVGAYIYGKESTAAAGNMGTASALVEEGLEAVRNIRYDDPENLSEGTFGIEVVNGEWVLSESPDQTDIFTREVEIEETSIDRFDIEVRVEWESNSGNTRELSATTRLTTWIQH